MKAPYILTTALAALMVLQSVLGLVFQAQYRDVEWIKATWFGNDWVTLAVAAPLVPIWGTLAVFTTAVTLLLLTSIRRERGPSYALTGAGDCEERDDW